MNLGVGAYRDDNNKPVMYVQAQRTGKQCPSGCRLIRVEGGLCTAILNSPAISVLVRSPRSVKSVAEAAKRLHDAKMNNEYAPIAGEPEFAQRAVELAFGTSSDAHSGLCSHLPRFAPFPLLLRVN